MYPVTPARQTRVLLFSKTTSAGLKLLIACLVFASVALALYVRVDSKNLKTSVTPGSKDSKSAVTVQAAGRGGQFLKLQDGHSLQVSFHGDQNLTAALQSNQARPRSLASADLNGDAAPDLLSGYGYGGRGILTVQSGNTDAFAPKDEAVYQRIHDGYKPASLLPGAQTYDVPEAADFLQAGDFNNDGFKDVVVGTQGGDLFLLAGDGQGNLAEPVQIALSGVVTALASGEFRAPDGRTDLAVGVNSPAGPQVLIFDGANGISAQPMQLALTSPATALEFGEVDAGPFSGLAIATGSQIEIIHGWGRKLSLRLESRVEKLDAGMNVRGLASGFFIWSREGTKQIAALGDDGTIRIYGRGELNTQPFNEAEITARGRRRLLPKDRTPIDVEALSGWQATGAQEWKLAREVATGNAVAPDATGENSLRGAHVSFTDTDDLFVVGANRNLDIVRQVDAAKSSQVQTNLTEGDLTVNSLESSGAPTSVLALPQKLNGERELLVMQSGDVLPSAVIIVPNATITVDRTDDPAIVNAGVGAAACTAAANDCSLRGAVEFANSNSGTVISLSTATYVLTTNGTNGCLNENAITGNRIGDLEVNQSTTITGTGAANSIIRQGSGANDRVFCLDTTLTAGRTYAFSALTITGGRDTSSGVGGGGIIGGAKGTTLNLTNVTFANNQTTGPASSGGGGVAVTGGDMNVTTCTFGAATTPTAASSKNDLTLGNLANSNSGGGLDYSAGDPLGVNGATGTLTITGTTFTHNASSSVSAGGGGLDVFEFNVSAGTVNISTSAFTSNAATGTASGGGIMNQSENSLTIATTSFTSNSAGNRGGGLYVGGGNGTFLNGTTPSITFASNTAGTAGSSISAAGAVTLSGTNTTIGGDLEITTNGTWTNSAGSAMSPTNFIMTGTANFIGNNSTTNVSGNFNFGSGTFNAGTSTFNFNGSAPAQSITNASSITFFNLTDSNTTNPLTLNNSFAIAAGGTLNINGANAILAPVAGAIISGGGALTGTGTARVTKTGADSFFSQYAMTGGRTLTNMTVEYIGAAAQTASTTTYNILKINNASGVTLNAGNTIVNSTLILTAGALNVSTNTLTINDGTSVAAGSLTSAATGTVNYNQSSAGQSVLAGTYGNLTFSAFTKVLPSTGTIFVASVFNPNGVTTGHTITGSTFDFNGTGAQTVPVFDYNNLTISGARGANNVTLASGIINIAGNFTANETFAGGGFITTGNTVNFNGGVAQSLTGTATTQSFNNFTVNKGGGSTLTAGGSLTTLNIAGAVTLTAGGFNAGTLTSIVLSGGDWTNNGGTFTPGSSVVSFTNTAAGQNINGSAATQTFNGITVAKTAQTLAVGGSTTTLNLNGSLTLTSGVFNAGTAAAINVGGNWTNNGGTFTPGTGTVTFNGAGAQNLNGTAATQTFNNFVVNKSGGSTLTGGGSTTTLTINGGVTLTAGTFAAGTITNIGVAGDWTNNGGTFTPGSSTVTFNSTTAAQNINGTAASQTFNSITVAKTGQTLTVGGSTTALTLNGSMNLTAGTFDKGTAANINVGGNWSNNGGTFTPGAGTVTFNSTTAAQAINGTAVTQSFNNITVNKTGQTLSVGGATTTLGIAGNLLLTAGTFDKGTAATINIQGNWTNNSSATAFTAGTGLVNFNGIALQTIGGTASTTFNNLTDANAAGITLGGNITVGGLLALGGNNINTSTFTLTQPGTGTSSGTGDVIGNVKRTTMVVNTTYSFGNPLNTIKIESGAVPVDINVNLVKAPPAGFAQAINRTYTITPNGANGPVTLRLHYLDAELNGNDPNTMFFRRFNGTTGWTPVTPTSRVTNADPNNWLEKTGQPTLSPWTMSSVGVPTATSGTISGHIADVNGVAVEGAVINLSGTQNRKTITDANGNYSFANVETSGFYTVRATRANYSFSPQERSFSQLGNQTEAAFTATAQAVTSNPVDTAEYFVRQHYLDFLGREPEEGGFNFWSDQILSCGSDAACAEVKRINVSAAYFLSIEFQTTGGLVDGLYRASFDRAPQYVEFLPDQAAVAKDVVVGRDGWEQQLNTNRQAFLDAFVQRQAFQSVYGGLSNDQYVDTLLTNTRIIWSQGEREALVNGLATGGLTRAGVLGQIATDQRFMQAKFNKTFVMMEYFGYLRRDPDADGYQYWLNKLNQFGGNFEQAEMVKAFIASGEYRGRFPR